MALSSARLSSRTLSGCDKAYFLARLAKPPKSRAVRKSRSRLSLVPLELLSLRRLRRLLLELLLLLYDLLLQMLRPYASDLGHALVTQLRLST